jgi:hypothetical protein
MAHVHHAPAIGDLLAFGFGLAAAFFLMDAVVTIWQRVQKS